MTDTQRSAAIQYGIPSLLLVVGLIVGWVGHGAAFPPGRTATASSFGDWTLTCPPYKEDKSSCALSSPVVEPQSKMQIANLMLVRQDGAMKMLVTFPLNLNILLEPGLGLVVGSDPMRTYHYETCAPSGCAALIPVDDKLMQSLRGAKNAQLVFAIPTKDRKPINMSFPLGAFSTGADAFDDNEKMRHSWWRRIWA
jgi:invasion protein IalB